MPYAIITVGGKQYPAGSFVVKSAQAFRPHIMDMFEPQDHPDDIPYPGAPPIQPYDVAGYTLAYQMGVVFDRILDGFDGPFEKLTDFAKPPAGSIRGAQAVALGCTELSVLRGDLGIEDPQVVDSIDAVAVATIRRAGRPLRTT